MPIDPVAHSGSLRLVGGVSGTAPVQPAAPTAPVAPASPARPEQPDSYSFESVYRANLPKVELTAAQARLEKIRHDLVAGQVAAPIHFEQSPTRSANPYAGAYAKLTPNPADVNAAATEQGE